MEADIQAKLKELSLEQRTQQKQQQHWQKQLDKAIAELRELMARDGAEPADIERAIHGEPAAAAAGPEDGMEVDEDAAAPAERTGGVLLSEAEAAALDMAAVQEAIVLLEAELQHHKPDLAAIDEYRRKEAEYTERIRDLESVTAERDTVRAEHDTLRKKRRVLSCSSALPTPVSLSCLPLYPCPVYSCVPVLPTPISLPCLLQCD